MSETTNKWTPGEWVAGKDNRVRQTSGAGRTIADVRYFNGENDKHLIAAAPKMAEELNECDKDFVALEWCVRDASRTDPRWHGSADTIRRRIDSIRAILSAARGEVAK